MECKEINLTTEESQAVNDTVKDILLNSIEEVKYNHNYNPESRRCEKCGKHIYDNLTLTNK